MQHTRLPRIDYRAAGTGKDVACLTLGDPTIYSTYIYIHRIVKAMVMQLKSSMAFRPLRGQRQASGQSCRPLRTASYYSVHLWYWGGAGTSRYQGSDESSFQDAACQGDPERKHMTGTMIENCGMRGEHIYHKIDEIPDRASYYSIIVVKEGNHDWIKASDKKYDHFLAVEDLNLKIETGEFFGLLGPNGAGKTTTIGMLSTLLLPTSGEIWINGELLTRQKNQLKQNSVSLRRNTRCVRIWRWTRLWNIRDVFIICRSKNSGAVRGICWNSAGWSIIGRDRPKAFRRHEAEADGLPGTFNGTGNPSSGWTDCRDGCICPPSDVESSEKLNQQKLTILLTTHYMEEAETLCDRVGFMCGGRPEETRCSGAYDRDAGAVCGRWDFTRWAEITLFSWKGGGNSVFVRVRTGGTALRSTTLEDVFLETIGQQLECR